MIRIIPLEFLNYSSYQNGICLRTLCGNSTIVDYLEIHRTIRASILEPVRQERRNQYE